MGFEICFKYYNKKSEGFGYDTEKEPEIMKVAVGKQWDEINLDEVAKAIFGQMAKRNILIVDAEVFEFTKKKVSFKMKDDGISIKNRKFSYDITGAIKSENDTDESIPIESVINNSGLEPHEIVNSLHSPQAAIASVETQQNQLALLQRKANDSEQMRKIMPPQGIPLRYEIYDPHPDIVRIAKQKGLSFTLNKKYPIFEEKPDRRGVQYGMLYITQDDNGNRQILNDKHFVPETKLTNDFNSEPNYIPSVAVKETVMSRDKSINLPDIYTLGKRR